VEGQRYGSEKLETKQVPERHQWAVVVTGIVSAKERPDRGGENLLQVMKVLKVRVVHNLSGIVVNEEVMESVKVRKDSKGYQKRQQQDVGPEY
jgi:hypothetical protein